MGLGLPGKKSAARSDAPLVIIIFAGLIGRSGLGGQAWAYMQYLLGLQALGHSVYYLEDCGETSWVFNWDTNEWTADLQYPARYVRECLEPYGFESRWMYRAGDSSEGMTVEAFRDVCSSADLLIMRGVPLWLWRPEYDLPKRRAFIDVDPGFTQISLANGNDGLRDALSRCEHLFTIGQRIGDPDCIVPTGDVNWRKTRPIVSLTDWPVSFDETAADFTTVMRFQGFREVTYQGSTYGQKDREFPAYLDIPTKTSQSLLLAVIGRAPARLEEFGWKTAPGWIISKTPVTYQEFIQHSRAEFSVPKHGYMAMKAGWFSDRSVCYLASGRPVLVGDTGLDSWLPTGTGVVKFGSLDEAVEGINTINSNYDQHRRVARRLAEDYFATDKVLPSFLDDAMR